MITTKTENIPLSMKEGSASYFVLFVCLSIGGYATGPLTEASCFSRLRSRFRFAHIVDGAF